MNNESIIQNVEITNIRISDGAYRCYVLLQSMCYGDKSSCYPSEKYLATALGRSIRTIQRYIKKLVKEGLIIIKRRGSISNLYTILAKKIKKTGQKIANTLKGAYKAYKQKIKIDKKQKQSTFNNFEMRKYNFQSLENMLLGNEKYDPEKLLE